MMHTEKILVIGACGQYGVELTLALRRQYGVLNVIAADIRAADIRAEDTVFRDGGLYLTLDILDRQALQVHVKRHRVNQVYLLAAMLSATGEAQPHRA